MNGSVDGSNQAMSGKAARQAVASGARARVRATRARRTSAARVRALAASGELGNELLQKVNGDLKTWYRDKLAHGVSVVSAGSNVRARQAAERELSAVGTTTSSNGLRLNANLAICLKCIINQELVAVELLGHVAILLVNFNADGILAIALIQERGDILQDLLAVVKNLGIVVADDVAELDLGRGALDGDWVIEALVALGVLRALEGGDHLLELGSHGDCVDHDVLGAARVNHDALEVDVGVSCVEALVVELSEGLAVDGVAVCCAKFVQIKQACTMTDLLVRDKRNLERRMSELRVVAQALEQGADLSHTGLIVSGKQRGAIGANDIHAHEILEVRDLLLGGSDSLAVDDAGDQVTALVVDDVRLDARGRRVDDGVQVRAKHQRGSRLDALGCGEGAGDVGVLVDGDVGAAQHLELFAQVASHLVLSGCGRCDGIVVGVGLGVDLYVAHEALGDIGELVRHGFRHRYPFWIKHGCGRCGRVGGQRGCAGASRRCRRVGASKTVGVECCMHLLYRNSKRIKPTCTNFARTCHNNCKKRERRSAMANDFWIPQFHLFPPQGWMNDPNGLCQFKSVYHAFYQYTPEWPANELRFWGHAVSKDLLSWETLPIAISPDAACDKDGAFSGSAWIETSNASAGDCGHGGVVAAGDGNDDARGSTAAGEVMRLFYTGNVMDETHPEADGIDVGREAYEVMVTSEDGLNFSPKCVVLKPADYPNTCTNHVRDPKVWEQDGALRMLLGARERDTAAGPAKSADERYDSGAALIYDSSDCGKSWTLHSVIRGANDLGHREAFGYMWECPFLVQLDGQEFLSMCPQGLREGAGTGLSAGTESSIGASKGSRLNDSANLQESASGEPLDKWQNIWQSGYFPLPEGQKLINVETVSTDNFVLWDHGFDFYAPQTFVDDSGRTILIGWMGIIDPIYYSYPAGIGFCHNLTLPRELSLSGDGVILQRPVKELDAKRRECVEFFADTVVKIDQLSADIEITGISGDGTLTLNDALVLSYSKGIFILQFIDEDTAAGRTQRSIELKQLSDLRIVVDGSTVEIYLNGGRVVFSTRWFPASEHLTLNSAFVASGSRAYSLVA